MTQEDITEVAVLGAGTMGAGIAQCFAQAGFSLRLYARREESLERARCRIEQSLANFLAEEIISPEESLRALDRLSTTMDLAVALEGAQYVVESIPEVLEQKQALFQEVDGLSPSTAFLTTNTSGLSISRIAEAVKRPERVAGMHWTNPAEIVPLVEIVRGDKTSEKTVEAVIHVALRIGKAPVVVQRDIPGFISNRLQLALFREALALVQQGICTPREVDRALKCGVGFRYPWLGPLETADFGGLDVFHRIAGYLFGDLSNLQEPPPLLEELVRQKRWGLKAGAGFYDYTDVDKGKELDRRDKYYLKQLRILKEMGVVW